MHRSRPAQKSSHWIFIKIFGIIYIKIRKRQKDKKAKDKQTKSLLKKDDTAKGVDFVSQKEQVDTSTPAGRLMLTIFAGLAQFERECLLERQAEGIAIAKQEGRMGRPEIQPCADFDSIVKDWQNGKMTAVEAMKQAGMTKATFYRKVKAMQQ